MPYQTAGDSDLDRARLIGGLKPGAADGPCGPPGLGGTTRDRSWRQRAHIRAVGALGLRLAARRSSKGTKRLGEGPGAAAGAARCRDGLSHDLNEVSYIF